METKGTITQATLLRTLTEKSTLKFGKYADFPIWKLLESGSGRSYLSWVYYNSSNISFIDDVLLKLNIRQNERINKPGINKELDNEKRKKIAKWQFAKDGYKAIGKKKRAVNNYLRGQSNLSKITKGALARTNQGH